MVASQASMDALNRREQIAESYLDHILIAVNAGDRGAPFRDFLDNWHAFRTGAGHLTKGDRPIWFNNPCAHTHQAALSNMQFISRAADLVLKQALRDGEGYFGLRKQKHASVRLMVDHAVPIKVIITHLFNETGKTVERSRNGILQHLGKFYRMGVVTAAEDDLLNKAGLKDKMPIDWNGEEPFARYQAVGINAS